MPQPTISPDLDQAADVHVYFTPQVGLNLIFAVDDFTQTVQLVLRKDLSV